MKVKKFEPKGKDVLTKEIIDNYGLDPENDKELIGKIVDDRYKDEQFKASEKNKTLKAREEAENMRKGKEYYKRGGQPSNEDNQDPNGQPKYVTADELDAKFHRQKYAYLSDDEYGLIKAEAERSNKTFEDTMENNKVINGYLKSVEARSRLERVSMPPGTRIDPGKTEVITDAQRELAQKCGNPADEVYKS